MSLIKWAPFGELDALQREMNQLLEQFVPERREKLFSGGFVPAAELKETDEAISLKLEIPGLSPDDIDVQVTAEAVSISGERTAEASQDEGGMTRSEFHYGRFQRIIPLPALVQNTAASAEYKDGILTLHLPKEEAEQKRVVKVAVS